MKHHISVDTLQQYIAQGVILFPSLYRQFLVDMQRLSTSQQVDMLPLYIFELYHMHILDLLEERKQRTRRLAK